MLFREIQQGYPVYILNKQDMTVTEGKVTGNTFPRMDTVNGKTQMVVDVNIEMNGKTATYTIPESISVTFAGNLVLATDQEGLAREVEVMKNNAEKRLASVDKDKMIVDKAKSLLAELNPIYKEKQQTEQRFGKIEGSITDLKDMIKSQQEMMKQQQEMMSKFIAEFKS